MFVGWWFLVIAALIIGVVYGEFSAEGRKQNECRNNRDTIETLVSQKRTF